MLRDVYIAAVGAAETELASTGLTVVKNPNDDQTRPASGFVDLEVLFGNELQASRGGSSAHFQSFCSLVASVNVPTDVGIGAALGAADTLAEGMRGRIVTATTGESLLFFGARIDVNGTSQQRTESGTTEAFARVIVELPFEVFATRTVG